MRTFMEVEEQNGTTFVKLSRGSFLLPSIETINQELVALAEENGSTTLDLDFSGVESLTAAGLGKLVALHTKLERSGRQLTLHGIRRDVYEAFEATNLSRLFHFSTRLPAAGGR